MSSSCPSYQEAPFPTQISSTSFPNSSVLGFARQRLSDIGLRSLCGIRHQEHAPVGLFGSHLSVKRIRELRARVLKAFHRIEPSVFTSTARIDAISCKVFDETPRPPHAAFGYPKPFTGTTYIEIHLEQLQNFSWRVEKIYVNVTSALLSFRFHQLGHSSD
jgi:hypothetical protein